MQTIFRGEAIAKVDGKGRVSIPAPFRRVLEAGDPDWPRTDGGADAGPNVIVVYGGATRNYFECFTVQAMAGVDRKILKYPRASGKRRSLQRLYNGQAYTTAVDETGRIVLPVKLRNKLGLAGEAFFIGNGDTFEILASRNLRRDHPDGLDDRGGFRSDCRSRHLPRRRRGLSRCPRTHTFPFY